MNGTPILRFLRSPRFRERGRNCFCEEFPMAQGDETCILSPRLTSQIASAVACLLTAPLFFLAVPLCLAATEGRDVKNETVSTIIQKEQNGRRFEVLPGSLIDIQLPFLGSAGYGWHVENLDTDRLDLVLHETRRLSDEGRIGGAVMGIWRFRAIKPGNTEIRMNYYRVWEGRDTSKDQFNVEIVIKSSDRQ
jgi:predicted secreted protein